MTTTAGARAFRRRGPQLRRAGGRRMLLAAVLSVLLPALAAGCRADGAAVVAPYRSAPPAQVGARVITGTAGVLALSPDGSLSTMAGAEHGVCFHAVVATAPDVCAHLPSAGSAVISAAFSADGRWVAVGQGVSAQRPGLVWLVDPRTGAARPVPSADGRPAAIPTRPTGTPAPGSAAAATSTGASTRPSTGSPPPSPAYIGMVWAASGDLLLISNSLDATGARTRLVDVDPVSLNPRVVAEATGPYEFQSGYLATGGSTVLFTVYRGDQLETNLVTVDLDSGKRRVLGPIGPSGTQLVPLAVSPDGRVAVVGSATLTDPGPPRLLDVASGALTDIPGLTGDFGVAAFSPDGARAAVASTGADGRVSLALASISASPLAVARTVGSTAGPLPRGGRMSWSRFDVLSLTGPAVPGPASLTGWQLTR